jgi:RNA polymerase sigma factor for flagellar operon FliA
MKAEQHEYIQEVWKDFFRKRDKENRNILILHYLSIVKYTAERIHARLPKNVELADLVSAGIFGMTAAIDMFNPEVGAKFETYCVQRIRGSILDELRKTDWVPRLVRTRARQLERATQKLEAILGRLPTEIELAEELRLDMKQFHHLQQDANATSLISLNEKSSESDGYKDIQKIDIIEDKRSQNPLMEAHKRDMRDFFRKGFSTAEGFIIILYYFEEMTMKEIGQTLGISESRVSQMHSSIIARLKARMNAIIKEPLKTHRIPLSASLSPFPSPLP